MNGFSTFIAIRSSPWPLLINEVTKVVADTIP